MKGLRMKSVGRSVIAVFLVNALFYSKIHSQVVDQIFNQRGDYEYKNRMLDDNWSQSDVDHLDAKILESKLKLTKTTVIGTLAMFVAAGGIAYYHVTLKGNREKLANYLKQQRKIASREAYARLTELSNWMRELRSEYETFKNTYALSNSNIIPSESTRTAILNIEQQLWDRVFEITYRGEGVPDIEVILRDHYGAQSSGQSIYQKLNKMLDVGRQIDTYFGGVSNPTQDQIAAADRHQYLYEQLQRLRQAIGYAEDQVANQFNEVTQFHESTVLQVETRLRELSLLKRLRVYKKFNQFIGNESLSENLDSTQMIDEISRRMTEFMEKHLNNATLAIAGVLVVQHALQRYRGELGTETKASSVAAYHIPLLQLGGIQKAQAYTALRDLFADPEDSVDEQIDDIVHWLEVLSPSEA